MGQRAHARRAGPRGRAATVVAASRVRRAFERLHADVRARFPRIRAVLGYGAPRLFPAYRDLALTVDGPEKRVLVSRRLEGEPLARVEGVLRHEFGHVVQFGARRRTILRRLPVLRPHLRRGHVEREADRIAWALWGDAIRYDRDRVQNVRRGTRPRPRELGL